MNVNTSIQSFRSPLQAKWGAVVAMALCATVLISSEFLPVSLLTPIATDLGITEGHAGQSISISGLFALLTSLFIPGLIGVRDRRHVVLFFTSLMAVSGFMVAFAPNAAVLMTGRALLGISIGGFWSISTAIVMRLVPRESIPKALALLNGGNAAAATLAAPLGSLLGSIIGWRGAFFCVIPLAAVAFIWQWRSVPALPAEKSGARIGAVFALLAQRQAGLGMAAVMLLFMGQFMLFTYLRPFLEVVTNSNAPLLSLLLLIAGLAGIVGTWLIGILLRTRFHSLLIAIPALMGIIAAGLTFFGRSPLSTGILLAAWGLLGTAAPVGWGTWLSRTLPRNAETGGSLMVAVIQLGITAGAIGGGVLFDLHGYPVTFAFSSSILFLGAFLAVLTRNADHRLPAPLTLMKPNPLTHGTL